MVPPLHGLKQPLLLHDGICLPQHLRDLGAAWQVQQNLFPRQLPAAIGWEFAADCRPAQTVAGDYYDLFEAAPGHLAVALGDVAGKGLGPALVMAGLHALVRCRLSQTADRLPALVDELNRYLLGSTPADLFVTLFLAVLEVRTGRLCYVNGGHPAPLLLNEPAGEVVRLSTGGTVLGILPGASYGEGEIELSPGSLLALFSDGLIEAADAKGEAFRERRVVEVLCTARAFAAQLVLTSLLEAVERFTGREAQADDLSLVVVRRQSL
jgi:sigma-B regulation protein RsbU (phosphoserine phosphatase)